MADPVILDGWGNPATYRGGAQVYEGSQDSRYRLQRPQLDREMASMVTRDKHRAMMADARWIYVSFPLVSGAVKQKSQYVSAGGWNLQFAGEDEEWGRRAEKLLRAHDRSCDVRGPMFSFAKCWEIGCRLWDIDGDFFVALVQGPGGYPQLQFLEAYRIGTRWGATAIVPVRGERTAIVAGGAYDGARIIHGVVYDDAARPIAYHVLGSTPERDRFVAARDMLHVANPSWFSEGRPFPTIAYAVLDLYDVKETRGFEKIAQKLNSAIAILESNEAGRRPENINNVSGTSATLQAAQTGETFSIEAFEGGMIRYLKSRSGQLTAHESRRPGDGWLKFDRTLLAGAFYGMEWRIEMLDLSLLGGAPTRGFQDNINTAIFARWGDLAPYALRAQLWRIASFIERGDLPAHPEWDQWAFTPPPEFTVDPHKQSSTDLENVRAGFDTHPDALRRRGYDPEDALRRQARYLKLRARVAQAEGVDPKELGRLDQPGDAVGGEDESTNRPANSTPAD